MKNLAKKSTKQASSSLHDKPDGKRRTKLKPVHKEKYKPHQHYQWQEEDEESDFNPFDYLADEDED